MSFWSYRPYVPVAKRRAQAAKEVEKLKKKGRVIHPVVLEGRKIAQSFWGKAWCDNLERYSDFENRLPRGRTYVRNGSVVDLQIARGGVRALVSGSDIYEVKIDIALAAPERWKAICRDCAGSIGSLVELLKGKLSKNVMERVCRENDGLFPAPRDIKMSCTCPDWADMCKHVAATLYGAGARLEFGAGASLHLTGRRQRRIDRIRRRRRSPLPDGRLEQAHFGGRRCRGAVWNRDGAAASLSRSTKEESRQTSQGKDARHEQGKQPRKR